MAEKNVNHEATIPCADSGIETKDPNFKSLCVQNVATSLLAIFASIPGDLPMIRKDKGAEEGYVVAKQVSFNIHDTSNPVKWNLRFEYDSDGIIFRQFIKKEDSLDEGFCIFKGSNPMEAELVSLSDDDNPIDSVERILAILGSEYCPGLTLQELEFKGRELSTLQREPGVMRRLGNVMKDAGRLAIEVTPFIAELMIGAAALYSHLVLPGGDSLDSTLNVAGIRIPAPAPVELVVDAVNWDDHRAQGIGVKKGSFTTIDNGSVEGIVYELNGLVLSDAPRQPSSVYFPFIPEDRGIWQLVLPTQAHLEDGSYDKEIFAKGTDASRGDCATIKGVKLDSGPGFGVLEGQTATLSVPARDTLVVCTKKGSVLDDVEIVVHNP